MSKYWIFDRDDTPQGYPLRKLIAKIREVAGTAGCGFFVRRSEGYGLSVNHWGELLDQADEIAVSLDELERLSDGTEEWFYNLDARCVTPTAVINFGLHDSSMLFVEAFSGLAEKIIVEFSDVQVA